MQGGALGVSPKPGPLQATVTRKGKDTVPVRTGGLGRTQELLSTHRLKRSCTAGHAPSSTEATSAAFPENVQV